MQVTLKNDKGMTKKAKVGFSWTTLFFGFFTPLFRNDRLWTDIMFLLAMFTFGLSWLIFPFIYNRIYIKKLLKKGFYPADDESKDILVAKKMLAQPEPAN